MAILRSSKKLIFASCLWALLPLEARVPEALKGIRLEASQELHGNILPFWSKHAPRKDGFIGQLSEDLTARSDVPRGALLSTRILWTYSAAYRRFHDPRHLALARHAFLDLEKRFLDREQGGVFWTVDAQGQPLATHKQIYVQVFAIYGLAEFHRASGSKPALDLAIEIYRLVEKHGHDVSRGGYLEVFTREWTRPEGLAINAMGPQYAKSQNTNLHVMEAYTGLLRAWPDAGLRGNLRQLVETMLRNVVRSDGRHLNLFFDADWTVRSSDVSYGHDIEASWLLTDAAELLGDPDLISRTKRVALTLAEATLQEGQDADGGIYSEGGAAGVSRPEKEWWAQAEATVGFVNAYQLSKDVRFAVAARKCWTFIRDSQVDRKGGEWFWWVGRDGKPIHGSPKLAFWKCPYHNGRACMELMQRLKTMD